MKTLKIMIKIKNQKKMIIQLLCIKILKKIKIQKIKIKIFKIFNKIFLKIFNHKLQKI